MDQDTWQTGVWKLINSQINYLGTQAIRNRANQNRTEQNIHVTNMPTWINRS